MPIIPLFLILGLIFLFSLLITISFIIKYIILIPNIIKEVNNKLSKNNLINGYKITSTNLLEIICKITLVKNNETHNNKILQIIVGTKT